MKMKRHELLTKAYNGEIKQGETFKSEVGAVATYDGKKFVFSNGETVGMVASNITWEKVIKTVTVELTEEDVRTIHKAMIVTGDEQIKARSNGKPFASTWGLLEKSGNMLKELTGGLE